MKKINQFLILCVSLILTLKARAEVQLNQFDTINSCTSYKYIDQSLSCGSESYLQKFAIPYCETYLEYDFLFSSKAQIILAEIRSCLQDEMIQFFGNGLTCENIEDYGIESHERCYLQSGFCNIDDIDRIMVMVIARNEIFNFKVMAVFSKVMIQCQFNNDSF